MRRCLLALTILLLPATIALAEKSKPRSPATDGAFPLLESQGHSLHGAPWQPVETLSFSTLHGIDAIPAPAFDLPMEDHDFYLLQDEANGSGTHHTALRIGVAQSVNMSVEHGEWIDVNGGSLWRIEVSSPNALSSRLQLTGINLPAGQELMITAPGVAESTVGPIEGVGEFGNGTAWGICTGSNRTMIEWFVPHGQRVKGLPFTGVNYEHGYRDIFRALAAGGRCAACAPVLGGGRVRARPVGDVAGIRSAHAAVERGRVRRARRRARAYLGRGCGRCVR